MYTRKQNVFMAKKLLSQIIYNSAYVEGCNITFPQTETILQGMRVNNVKMDDIQTIINLRDAWNFILMHLDDDLDLTFINKVNENISRNESLDWGVLRYGKVGISGTNYRPDIPNAQAVMQKLQELNQLNDPVEKACEYFCWATHAQLYWDGNKRTSTLVANAILIKDGGGLFTISEETAEEFNDKLLMLYNHNDAQPLKKYIQNQIEAVSQQFSFERPIEQEENTQ